PRPPSSSRPGSQQVPPYYIALPALPGLNRYVAIYATTTGRLVTIPRYRGMRLGGQDVAGSEDGRTFVIADEAANSIASRFYLARFNPATGKAAVTLLPTLQAPDANGLQAMALSPDGTKLAIGYEVSTTDSTSGYGKYRLVVDDLRTGNTRTWTNSHGELAY